MSETLTSRTMTSDDFETSLTREGNFILEFSFLDKNIEAILMNTVSRYLAYLDRMFLKDSLCAIIKELITNAVKANAKRLYFRTRNLDIHNPAQYQKGMESFRKEVLVENSRTVQGLSLTDLKVSVTFSLKSGMPNIIISNNIPIVEEELLKIRTRINKAYEYNDITEAFGDMLDNSEGAGLGLIMAIMVFKNSGFSRDDFVLNVTGDETSFGMYIHDFERSQDYETRFTEEILKEIDYLPAFPETAVCISGLCDKKPVKVDEITKLVLKDPALTASVLKKVNGAGASAKQVSSLDEALKLIGTKELKTLADSSGKGSPVPEKKELFRNICEESYRKAFYAAKISIQTRYPELSDIVYMAALLSKIGEMALLSIKPDTTEKLAALAGLQNFVSLDFLEELTLGISRPTLSSHIIEKWNFGTELCSAVKYFQRPHMAPLEIRIIVYILYLSDIMIEFEKNKIRYNNSDKDVLGFFNIDNEMDFKKLSCILKEAYSLQQQNN